MRGSMWSVKNWKGCSSPYSSPMKSIGTKGDRWSTARRGAGPRRQPVAQRPVADLVVVLGVDDEPRGRTVVGGRAVAPAPEGEAPVVDERLRLAAARSATAPKSA